jgi:TRAP-type C4-dicarboxylate transport system permease small subunit
MQHFETAIIKISRIMDLLAGIILAATASLVVANILGRVLFNRPILGTYEMVGFLTAAVVGLALARCALENSHIAISFLTDKLPPSWQRFIELAVDLPATLFLFFAAYNLFAYGLRLESSGVVSSTIRLPFYPFIYLVAAGFFMLACTVLLSLLKQVSGGEAK